MDLFDTGKVKLLNGECSLVRPMVERITELMTVPLIQGTLRYAYKGEYLSASGFTQKEKGEGAVFAASVLPRVASCSAAAAATIQSEMQLDASTSTKPDFEAVKAAFESTYSCLNITCAAVGGLWDSSATAYYSSASPCTDYPLIAGYAPGSGVTDHNNLDLDQAALETQLAESPADFTTAQAIYTQGGNSKAYAEFTVPAISASVAKGAAITCVGQSGSVSATTYAAAASGDTVLKLKYAVGTCNVGGLNAEVQVLTGCCTTGAITVAGLPGSITPSAVVNKAGRTLAGFSTGAEAKMLTGCVGCPYKDFQMYYDYYGAADYAHQWITAALDGTSLTLGSGGTTDFSVVDDAARIEAVKKGTAYMSVWMYTIREFEDAIDDCVAGSLTANYDAVHAWDEGVAFYTGSLEGTDGSGSGKMVYALADKRCINFKTCGDSGDALSGTSKVSDAELARACVRARAPTPSLAFALLDKGGVPAVVARSGQCRADGSVQHGQGEAAERRVLAGASDG